MEKQTSNMAKDYKQINIGTVDFLKPLKVRMEAIKGFRHVKSVKNVHGIGHEIIFVSPYYFHCYRVNPHNKLLYDLIIRKPL